LRRNEKSDISSQRRKGGNTEAKLTRLAIELATAMRGGEVEGTGTHAPKVPDELSRQGGINESKNEAIPESNL